MSHAVKIHHLLGDGEHRARRQGECHAPKARDPQPWSVPYWSSALIARNYLRGNLRVYPLLSYCPASEGAAAFAERSAALLPQSAVPIHDISNLYIRLRYGGLSEDDARQELNAQVARFRPARRS